MFSSPAEWGSSSHRSALFRRCGLFLTLLNLRPTTAEKISGDSLFVNELASYCDAKANVIYFVDKDPAAIRSYHPNEDFYYGAPIADAKTNESFTLSFAIPIEKQAKKFVVGLSESLGVVTWDGKSNGTLNPEFYIDVAGVVNTASTDTNGLLWFVTPGVDSLHGSMYSVDSSGKILDNPISMSGLKDNIAFSANKFYYTDSESRIIYGMDYNPKTMAFSNSEPVVNMSALSLTGMLGGLTVDSKGNLWIACHFDSILGFDTNAGSVIGPLPVPDPSKVDFTSVVLCGSDLGDLYATTNTDPNYQIRPLHKVDTSSSSVGTGSVPAKFPTVAPP